MIKGVTHAHFGPIWYHSEPSDVRYSPNQFLGCDFFCRYIHQDGSRKTFILAPQNKLYLIKWDCQWVKIEAWTRYWLRCEIILRFIHCRVCSNFLYKKLLKTQDEEIEAILAYEDEVKTQGHRNRYNLIDRQSMFYTCFYSLGKKPAKKTL